MHVWYVHVCAFVRACVWIGDTYGTRTREEKNPPIFIRGPFIWFGILVKWVTIVFLNFFMSFSPWFILAR